MNALLPRKLTNVAWKIVLGRRSFPFEMAPFYGTFVSFAGVFFIWLSERPMPHKIWPKQAHTRWFKVTFWSPSWRSLNLWKGHLTIPKRSQRIARYRIPRKTQGPQEFFGLSESENYRQGCCWGKGTRVAFFTAWIFSFHMGNWKATKPTEPPLDVVTPNWMSWPLIGCRDP